MGRRGGCAYVWEVREGGGGEGGWCLQQGQGKQHPVEYLEGSELMEMGCKERSTADACHQVL